MSDNVPGIHAKIAAVKRDIGAIAKSQTNTHFKYDFRGIEDALTALDASMVKHGVHTRTEITEHAVIVSQREGKYGPKHITKATLMLRVFMVDITDGSECCFGVGAGEAEDESDKATNKAMAAAYKYAIFLGLAIPTQLDDSDRGEATPVVVISTEDAAYIAEAQQEITQSSTLDELKSFGAILKGKGPQIQNALRSDYATRARQLTDQ